MGLPGRASGRPCPRRRCPDHQPGRAHRPAPARRRRRSRTAGSRDGRHRAAPPRAPSAGRSGRRSAVAGVGAGRCTRGCARAPSSTGRSRRRNTGRRSASGPSTPSRHGRRPRRDDARERLREPGPEAAGRPRQGDREPVGLSDDATDVLPPRPARIVADADDVRSSAAAGVAGRAPAPARAPGWPRSVAAVIGAPDGGENRRPGADLQRCTLRPSARHRRCRRAVRHELPPGRPGRVRIGLEPQAGLVRDLEAGRAERGRGIERQAVVRQRHPDLVAIGERRGRRRAGDGGHRYGARAVDRAPASGSRRCGTCCARRSRDRSATGPRRGRSPPSARYRRTRRSPGPGPAGKVPCTLPSSGLSW